jgi:hypothetical protein
MFKVLEKLDSTLHLHKTTCMHTVPGTRKRKKNKKPKTKEYLWNSSLETRKLRLAKFISIPTSSKLAQANSPSKVSSICMYLHLGYIN